MEPFEHFRVVIVGSAEVPDRVDVVEEGMQFWNVHVLANAELLQDILVLVEEFESVGHILERRVVVSRVLRQINEIEQRAEGEHDVLRNLPY